MLKTAVPAYQRAIEGILQVIVNRNLHSGDLLPTEAAWCEMFDISRGTLRKALAMLEKEGVLESRRPHGSFLSDRAKAEAILSTREIKHVVGIITSEMRGYLFPRVVEGLSSVLYPAGFSFRVYETQNDLKTERRFIEEGLAAVDGFILAPVVNATADECQHLHKVESLGKPSVFFDRAVEGIDFDRVVPSSRALARRLVTYLFQKGHSRIGYLGLTTGYAGQEKLAGYQEALEALGVAFDETLISPTTSVLANRDTIEYEVALDKLLELPQPPSAIYVTDAPSATAINILLNERGQSWRTIPLAVHGEWSSLWRNVVAWADEKWYEVGQKAADLFLQRITGQLLGKPVTVVVKPDMVTAPDA